MTADSHFGIPFSEVDDYLGGTMRIDEHVDYQDEEHEIELMTEDQYDAYIKEEHEWPFHLDFNGHPIGSELSTFDDHDQHNHAA